MSKHIFQNGYPFSAITGRGPSDDMAEFLGLDPNRCFIRFLCKTIYTDMIGESQAEVPVTDYGFHGPSEDFAEAFWWSVTRPSGLVAKAPERASWMQTFASGLTRIRQRFNRDNYPGVVIPVENPECSWPFPVATPEPIKTP